MNTPKKARIDLRVPEELKEEIQKEAKKRNITVTQLLIESYQKVKDGEDIEVIKSKTEALVQSSLKLGEAIYKQNPQDASPQQDQSSEEPSSDKKDEKVVDAEFEEVDENKKD